MTNYREILRLHHQGISGRSIAASCRCSRNTVASTLKRAEACGISWPLPNGMSDADLIKCLLPAREVVTTRRYPDFDLIHKELAKSVLHSACCGTNTVKNVG